MTAPFLSSVWSVAASDPERVAVVSADGTAVTTFGQLADTANRLGAVLRARSGQEQPVIAVQLPDSALAFAVLLACLDQGLRFLPFVETSPAPWRALLSCLRVGVIVSSEQVGPVLDQALAGLDQAPRVLLAGPQLEAAVQAADPSRAGAPAEGRIIFRTSGTTGASRLVWPPDARRRHQGVAVDPRAPDVDPGPFLLAGPAHHRGFLDPAYHALQGGRTLVIADAWDPVGFAETVQRHAVTGTFLVPAQLADLDRAWDGETTERLRTLHSIGHGAAPCPPEVKRRLIERLGPVLVEYYAFSECVVSRAGSADWIARPGTAGRPLPGVGVLILDGDRTCAAGEVGEIHVRPRAVDAGISIELEPPRSDRGAGPAARSPEVREGFVRTGDLGMLDHDGWLFVVGRACDRANRYGTVVSTTPITTVLRQHPSVAEVEVFTESDPGLADRIVACVVLKPDAGPEICDRLRRLPAERLGDVWAPDLVLPLASIPRGAAGKRDLVALRRLVEQAQVERAQAEQAPVREPVSR